MKYEELYREFCVYLNAEVPMSTEQITDCVKRFFEAQFEEDYSVLCSGKNTTEYLCDVLVTNFNPKRIIEERTLDVLVNNPFAYMAVESELGGTGGSSAYGVMKNVVEDFLKLLLVRARYRVLIFTSLPYKVELERDHVIARVNTLRSIYDTAIDQHEGMLLIHLAGTQPRSKQVQAVANTEALRGFVFGSEAGSVREISA